MKRWEYKFINISITDIEKNSYTNKFTCIFKRKK